MHYGTKGELEQLFDEGAGGRCYKWRHYWNIYERYLAPFKGKPCSYLEVGIYQGGTLEIIRKYLGEQARIIGVDIDPGCKALEAQGYEIHIGNQSDTAFLNNLGQQLGGVDIIVDDGGHTADQQITTFLALFPYLNEGGIFIVEDLHANLWHSHHSTRYGINFFDFAKGLADKMTHWHLDPASFERYHLPYDQRPPMIPFDNFATKQIYGIHFYDSVVVFEKRTVPEPMSERK